MLTENNQREVGTGDSISVVIPTFRRPDRLVTAVRSAANQSQLPAEIIVSDNDPGGSAQEVCERLDVPQVVYLQSSEIEGASHARNAGALAAMGSWLAFLDDDDRWDSGYLEQALETGISREVEMVLSPALRDTSGLVTRGKSATESIGIGELLGDGNFGIVGSNIFIRARAFRALGGFDRTMPTSEDIDLLVRLIRGGFEYAVAPRELVVQTVHDEGQLSDYGSMPMYRGARRLLKKYAQMMDGSMRRKLAGRVHSRGYFAESGIKSKTGHIAAAAWNGNNTPIGDVVRRLKRKMPFRRQS